MRVPVMAAARSRLSVPVWVFLLLIVPDIFDVASAVDGHWSEWWEWDPCSASCGKGITKRYRFCNNPPPSNGGASCAGKSLEKKECEVPVGCPVDGEWTEWSIWSECSVTCGEGVRSRFRECNSPPPANGGRNCEGGGIESMTCISSKDCPRDGKWSNWSQWSACSVTCGDDGSNYRYRSCNNPPPSADGRPCKGNSQQARRCRAANRCSVNGHWSEWSEWSSCTVSCGSGVRTRWRKCDNPPPQNGGLDCSRTEAGEMQELSCNGTIVFCPVDGGWSDWSEWGECNAPNCAAPDGLYYQIRERSCSNPYPAHKGSMCQGTFLNAAMCDRPVNCPVDGEWSEWSDWKCEIGSVTRKRKCDDPPPSNGGKQCVGDKTETYLDDEEAYEVLCPNFEGGPDGSEENSGLGESDEENHEEEEEEEEEEDEEEDEEEQEEEEEKEEKVEDDSD